MRRLLPIVGALLLAACGSPAPTVSPPTTASSSASASASPAASALPTEEPSGPTAGAPPTCVDAKIVWADGLERLLLVNCFSQTGPADVRETVWAWDADAGAWTSCRTTGPSRTW